MNFIRLSESEWLEMLRNYKKTYGNIDVPQRFRTINGAEYDEYGYSLGHYVMNKRMKYRNGILDKDSIQILEELGINWCLSKPTWGDYFDLASRYFAEYGDLIVNFDFRTKDGINYDDNGVCLGHWISNQRRNYLDGVNIDEKQINLLNGIGMVWNVREHDWNEKYELAKAYYDTYGNLLIDTEFVTKDGINYDPDGVNLGKWVNNQVFLYKRGFLYPDRYKKLKEIGFITNYKEYFDDMYLRDKLSEILEETLDEFSFIKYNFQSKYDIDAINEAFEYKLTKVRKNM